MADNVEIFERVLQTFGTEGLEAAVQYFTEDAEVYDPDLPPGDYRGPEAVLRVCRQLMEGFANVEIKAFKLYSVGDRVIALLHTKSKGEEDDIEMEVYDAHSITFRDGKISYWRLYPSQAEALEDAGLDPSLALTPSSSDG